MSRVTRKHWRLEVDWDDSTYALPGWHPIDEVVGDRSLTRCVSVGFVLADDKHGIVLAGSVHGNEAAGVMRIPKGAIRHRRRLS